MIIVINPHNCVNGWREICKSGCRYNRVMLLAMSSGNNSMNIRIKKDKIYLTPTAARAERICPTRKQLVSVRQQNFNVIVAIVFRLTLHLTEPRLLDRSWPISTLQFT